MNNTLKSILAVLAGLFTVIILSTVTDLILEALHLFPSPDGGLFDDKLLIIAFIYRSIYTILGGYVTAILSPGNARKNVIVLGIIGTIFGILGVIAGWNLSHHWYPIAIAVCGFPCVWIGFKIFEKSKKTV
jgi:hypothetical protein